MLALKGVLLAAAAASVLGLAHPAATAQPQPQPQAPLVARCAYFNPQAQLDPSCVTDARQAPPAHQPKGKAKRLPRLRVVQVGARLHAHVTIAI